MPDSIKVLFVCVSNRGKSVMAERLTPTITDRIDASSAGTEAKTNGWSTTCRRRCSQRSARTSPAINPVNSATS